MALLCWQLWRHREDRPSVRHAPVRIDPPADTFPALQEAAEATIAADCRSVSIVAWRRPGEPDYLVAYVYDSTRHRHVFATPELRDRPIGDQAADLVRQLAEFQR